MKNTFTEGDNYFDLPQVRILSEEGQVLSDQPILFLAGGRAAERDWLLKLIDRYPRIWAVDSGANLCHISDKLPERVIGDLDSIDDESLTWLEDNRIAIDKYPPEKDLTDLQIAMKSVIKMHPNKPVIMSGCWGGRFDHNWSNLHSMVWANRQGGKMRCMADEKEVLFLIGKEERFSFHFGNKIPSAVSLIPLTGEPSEVTTEGLKWPLNGAILSQECPYSISNEVEEGENCFSVFQDRGWLGVYMTWIGESS